MGRCYHVFYDEKIVEAAFMSIIKEMNGYATDDGNFTIRVKDGCIWLVFDQEEIDQSFYHDEIDDIKLRYGLDIRYGLCISLSSEINSEKLVFKFYEKFKCVAKNSVLMDQHEMCYTDAAMLRGSRRTIDIRGRLLGGQAPLVCAPLVGSTRGELLQEARLAAELMPDCIEWRADFFDDTHRCDEMLREIREILPEMPVIFTLRIDSEGGFKHIAQDRRLEIICGVIATGQADMVDIELCNERQFIDSVREEASRHNVRIIISSHNFKATPDKRTMLQILSSERGMGADIAKLAVMPNKPADVLALMEATYEFAKYAPDVPTITVSMGHLGAISRIGGGVFGSALTFGALKKSSAPGQIPVSELKRIITYTVSE